MEDERDGPDWELFFPFSTRKSFQPMPAQRSQHVGPIHPMVRRYSPIFPFRFRE